MTRMHRFMALWLTVPPLLAAVSTGATPLRVDINSEGRADMRTVGWENWQPAADDMSQSFGELTVTLRAGSDGGSISLSGNKALVVHGVTLGADGAVATGGKSGRDGSPARRTRARATHLRGLSPRPMAATPARYTVSAGDRTGRGDRTVQGGPATTMRWEPPSSSSRRRPASPS